MTFECMPLCSPAAADSTKTQAIAALEQLYHTSDGPSINFLLDLLPKPTTRVWMLVDENSFCVAAAWYATVADEAELLDIRVKESHQGTGLGRELLTQTLDALRVEGTAQVFLEVRRSNLVAQNLYRSLSFSEIGERTNYYPSREGREDAILMALDLSVTR